MARQIGFHVYSVKVRVRHKRSLEILSAMVGQHDLLKVLHRGIQQILNAQKTDEAVERVTFIRKSEVSERHLVGMLEAGHYGEATDIVSYRSGQLMHSQKTDEAALLPCFFRLVIPEGKDQGLLILQRDNRVQSKGAFLSILSPILAAVDDSLGFHVEPIMNKETFEKLVGHGQIQQIKFIRLSVMQDFADEYDRERDQTEGSMELVVKARRGRSLPMKERLKSWFSSPDSVRDMYLVPGLEKFEYDAVKADIKIGKNKRTIDFGKKMSNPIIDLTEKISWRAGRPTWASLVSATLELVEDEMFDIEGDES